MYYNCLYSLYVLLLSFQLNNNQLSNKKVQMVSILDRSIFKKQKTEDFWK